MRQTWIYMQVRYKSYRNAQNWECSFDIHSSKAKENKQTKKIKIKAAELSREILIKVRKHLKVKF